MTNQEKFEVISEMLVHFRNDNEKTNNSLKESGDSQYCFPFEHIEVQDIKNYALKLVVAEEFIDL